MQSTVIKCTIKILTFDFFVLTDKPIKSSTSTSVLRECIVYTHLRDNLELTGFKHAFSNWDSFKFYSDYGRSESIAKWN